ncbi:MAG: phosphate signaling complex PhoU family protein [Methanobrevibacter sp.]|uniref:phosphate signaling complex PhoU family protein n=1 Tax=Methanobrevibacter sp. TaxID=66852 RepID=UPI003F09B2AD
MHKEYPSITFKNRIEHIEKSIEELGELAIKSNEDVISLLDNYDENTYLDVLNRSNEVDIKTIDLEKECISFMAIEQPVASDLMFIESGIRILSHIKRICRLFMKIAESIKNLQDVKVPEIIIKKLSYMGNRTQYMIKKSIFAFLNHDIEKSKELAADDDQIDDLYDTILEEATEMIESKESVPDFLKVITVVRYLERIADKTVNIGSRVIFMETFKRPEID